MELEESAHRFVAARRSGRGLRDYPGTQPRTLQAAYHVQQAAIAAWDDQIVGWKVGRITGALAAEYGADRFVGPVFSRTMHPAREGGLAEFPAIPDGFAAFEAEVLLFAAEDAPASKTLWSPSEAADLAGACHIGVEVAGSPLANIDQLGPLASVAAFGNNNGLIVGAEVTAWKNRDFHDLTCTTTIDGAVVGHGRATAVPGGPLTAFAFALSQAAKLGRPISKGQVVCTGAITGIHPVGIGQLCTAEFGSLGAVSCRVSAAAGTRS